MTFRELVPWTFQRGLSREGSNPFSFLQRDMNRMFNDFWRTGLDMGAPATSEWPVTYVPHVDVAETEKTVEVTAELAGLEPKDFELMLSKTNDFLTIRGEKKEEKEEKKKDYHIRQRCYGSFRQDIPLPCVVEGNIEATCVKGVLKVVLPKAQSEANREKKIPVKAG